MSFELYYHPDCLKKDIPSLDRPTLSRIKKAIESRLTQTPEIFGKPLRHTKQNLWSLRVGDWRVVYQLTAKRVIVLRIGHRRKVYENLE